MEIVVYLQLPHKIMHRFRKGMYVNCSPFTGCKTGETFLNMIQVTYAYIHYNTILQYYCEDGRTIHVLKKLYSHIVKR